MSRVIASFADVGLSSFVDSSSALRTSLAALFVFLTEAPGVVGEVSCAPDD